MVGLSCKLAAGVDEERRSCPLHASIAVRLGNGPKLLSCTALAGEKGLGGLGARACGSLQLSAFDFQVLTH